MPQVFVSYSRQDFYAAEALASVLLREGVQAWLDVEQLRPGTHWEIAINAAIDAADAVLVVASPASMASRWVVAEWRRALDAGTPIHVALVRNTELPPELAQAVVHDLRGRFFSEASRLAEVLTGRPASRSPSRLPMSPQMALLWSALLCGVLIGCLGVTLGRDLQHFYQPMDAEWARFGLSMALANAVGVVGLIYLTVQLSRRSLSPSALREGLFVAIVLGLLDLATILVVGDRSNRERVGPDAQWGPGWIYLVALVVAVLGFVLVSYSRTVHLQMPTGVGQDHLRSRVKGLTLWHHLRGYGRAWEVYQPKLAALKQMEPGGPPRRYWVRTDPGDELLAKLIIRGCDAAGFTKDEDDPRWIFVVVTARTTDQDMRDVLETCGHRVVFVLATSRSQPDDDLRQHQWLDFREQEPEELYEFLRMAATGRPAERGVVTVPTDVAGFRAPGYATACLAGGRALVGLTAAPVLGMLIAGEFVRAVPVLLVTAALAAAAINLVRGALSRSIDAAGSLNRALLVMVLHLVWLVLTPNLASLHPMTRVCEFGIVAATLLLLREALLETWLPPKRGPVAANLPAPPIYTFSLPLVTLLLAVIYSFFAEV